MKSLLNSKDSQDMAKKWQSQRRAPCHKHDSRIYNIIFLQKLNTTKVVLGFLELALAFKFLSNADLVKHWGILKIEVFLGIWILVFAGLTLYVFGKIKFPHDSPLKKLSFFRISSGLLVLAFVIYLGSGFKVNKETQTFTPLTLLSGLAPPVGYSFLYPNDCPNNFECFKDLKEGVAYAKKVNKPILLDFS